MPRKVTPHPVILFTQALSTGRLIKPEYIVNEIGPDKGKRIPVPQDMRPVRELPSGNDILTKQKLAKIALQRELLQAVGIIPDDRPKPPPRPIIPHKPGMRPVGKLGDNRVIYVPLPPYRRW